MVQQRHAINIFDVLRGEHGVVADIAKQRNLAAHAFGKILRGAAEQQVGLNPDFPQRLDTVLRRLGFQFLRSLNVRHERDMHVHDIFRADVGFELPDRLQKRLTLDVADRAADLGNHHIVPLRDARDGRLDFVRDVRNDLHGLAEIIAAPLFRDDRMINLAGRDVMIARRDGAGEALVMAEIEIGFRAVVRDIDFAVLVGVHRAGVNVEIGIEFLQRHFKAPAF